MSLLLMWASVAYAQSRAFVPPRLLTANVPLPPPPTVVGGGEVMIEVVVDRTGAVTHPVVVRSTSPYTQMVLTSVALWRFEPARATTEKGIEESVDMPVMIAAIYRPPAVYDNPVLGEPARSVRAPSGDVAYPIATAAPAFPVLAPSFNLSGSALLFEVGLSETGQITAMRAVVSDPGFESSARAALVKWRFRPASYRGRTISSTAYVLFGFRPPIVSLSP
jgi:outer membrane biosynthesis protein TonB